MHFVALSERVDGVLDLDDPQLVEIESFVRVAFALATKAVRVENHKSLLEPCASRKSKVALFLQQTEPHLGPGHSPEVHP